MASPPGPSAWETSVHRWELSADTNGGRQGQSEPQEASRKRNAQAKPTAEKKRKTTYDIRREQKVELKTQVEKLQKQLDGLKYQVLVEKGEATKSNERTAAGNSVLREFIQEQHVEFAKMQAMLATHLQQNIDTLHPAQTIIRLGTDRAERHNTLVALKNRKLREAKRFITARGRGLDPRSSYSQEERNNGPGEDYCIVLFENRAVHGATARDVFDAFIDVTQNAEIIISELFGSITIRENNDSDQRDLSQMRLVTSTSLGTVVESNTVMFAEFFEGTDDDEGNCGLIVADFVDSDELYPYKPEERVRGDTTTVFMIRSFMQPIPSSQSSGSNSPNKSKDSSNEKELVVVTTRWTCSKIRRNKMNLSADALRELQESTVSFGDTMKTCIQQRLGKTGMYDPKHPTSSELQQ
ncbi:hypothetical protein KRP22_002138 [Phytophthora ramorum]|uniref:uncharacterized protein n=1 Tax=Phytophthora ramorum TaxID=164328 RepID=UPI0030B40D9A|nr:hypothetical protein KRP23_1210 [Phytophthora ramorum]KAH7509927.1 hypothetical protein KRP22_1421 [Phytophthora ramorum]